MTRQTVFSAQCDTCKHCDCPGARDCDDCTLYDDFEDACYCICEPLPSERTCNRYERKTYEDYIDPESYYNIRKED